MAFRPLLLSLLAGVLGMAPPTLQAASLKRAVTIRDHLGVDWQDDLVHYRLDFARGALRGAACARVTVGNRPSPARSLTWCATTTVPCAR